VTICTKHRYGGPHACPYCERDTARAETARLREALEKYTNCWHCGDALLEEEPYHCEACPAWDCCDEGDCDEPGCIERTSDPEPTT